MSQDVPNLHNTLSEPASGRTWLAATFAVTELILWLDNAPVHSPWQTPHTLLAVSKMKLAPMWLQEEGLQENENKTDNIFFLKNPVDSLVCTWLVGGEGKEFIRRELRGNILRQACAVKPRQQQHLNLCWLRWCVTVTYIFSHTTATHQMSAIYGVLCVGLALELYCMLSPRIIWHKAPFLLFVVVLN